MKPSRVHRLLKLITMLQSGRSYLADDLARELKVSRRTLFRDLEMLHLANIPLVYNRGRHTYTIEKGFFLPPINFTFPEVLALMTLVHKHANPRTLPALASAVSAMLKIETTLPPEIREYCGSALGRLSYRPAPETHGGGLADTFELLWQAVCEQKTVRVAYDSYFEGREIRTKIDPYHLTFIARAWYVLAYSHMHREVRTFKLDRFVRVEPTGRTFRPDEAFDPARYFGRAWRMIPGTRRQRVKIRFSPKVAGNVEEVLWHPTQQTTVADDGSLIYEVEVDGVEEIAWWVLGYGREAVVEKPAALRKIVAGHVREMASRYAAS